MSRTLLIAVVVSCRGQWQDNTVLRKRWIVGWKGRAADAQMRSLR
jgi:hypothetical protein